MKNGYMIHNREMLPAFSSNNVVVSITSSDAYSVFLCVLIQSIVQNSSKDNNYDIVVLSNEIGEINKKIILDTIREYSNVSVRFFEIKDILSKYNFYTNYHITIMTYCRLMLLDILKNYSKCVYLDCDVILNHDIADLFNVELGQNYVAAAIDTVMAGWDNIENTECDCLDINYRKEQYYYNVHELGVKDVFKYFNAGILVMNLAEMRKKYNSDDLLQIASSRKWKWFDQDVLNKICYGKVVLLDSKWNFMSHDWNREGDTAEKLAPKKIYDMYVKARANPMAIHYCGNTIPCFAPNSDNAHYFWKYARLTPMYEKILAIMVSSVAISVTQNRGFLLRFVDKCLPRGSKRRDLLKKIMPRGSKQFEFLKKLYHKVTF
ncbi:glycosyltransferase family 8 protein [Veillonellaceae bacterium WCA-693-APC-5D-A]|uniref:Glycosyltransferase family 8 protein n=1 Tax=Anaerovibrio slackiae TaxID=2652309 RepID=A0A6I2UC99_9FIRM|nr:glycosyltransferase family 8 protein [Anaerovibrio slackiae]MSU09153.1 glycosyltransferase family 8 protein [Anaerovibrio slackiae]